MARRNTKGKAEPIGAILRGQLSALGLARRLREAAVGARWAELVGVEIAAHTSVIKIDRGTLLVAVDEPAWRQELLYQKEAIAAKLNAALGEGEVLVREIMFVGPRGEATTESSSRK